MDDVSLAFSDWHFSNQYKPIMEPLVRLNIESRGGAEILSEKLALTLEQLGGRSA
jgi:hypothetical protein